MAYSHTFSETGRAPLGRGEIYRVSKAGSSTVLPRAMTKDNGRQCAFVRILRAKFVEAEARSRAYACMCTCVHLARSMRLNSCMWNRPRLRIRGYSIRDLGVRERGQRRRGLECKCVLCGGMRKGLVELFAQNCDSRARTLPFYWAASRRLPSGNIVTLQADSFSFPLLSFPLVLSVSRLWFLMEGSASADGGAPRKVSIPRLITLPDPIVQRQRV